MWHLRTLVRICTKVSILVLVEIRNQIEDGYFQIICCAKVSILVLVEIRNQITRFDRLLVPITPVSILVLVEIRNQIISIEPPSITSEICFNPCFGGNQKSNPLAPLRLFPDLL